MTADDFRNLALSLPEAVEAEHMGHADFRVRGKIFATLGPTGSDWGMVKLKPEQQREFVEAKPKVFQPVKGGWGRQGCTQVCLKAVDKKTLATLRSAMFSAWLNTAPKRLVEELGHSDAES